MYFGFPQVYANPSLQLSVIRHFALSAHLFVNSDKLLNSQQKIRQWISTFTIQLSSNIKTFLWISTCSMSQDLKLEDTGTEWGWWVRKAHKVFCLLWVLTEALASPSVISPQAWYKPGPVWLSVAVLQLCKITDLTLTSYETCAPKRLPAWVRPKHQHRRSH